MKIKNTRHRNSKKLFLPLLIAAILLASWLVFASIKGVWPFETKSQDFTTTEQTITPEEQEMIDSENAQEKQDFLDRETSDNNDDEQSNTTAQNPEDDNPKIDLSARTQDDMLVVTTNLSTITSGECVLTLQQGQKTVTKRAIVIFAPNSSTCEGFSIDRSELGRGSWTITLAVKTNGGTPSKTINYTL